jgi:hypothetical protein
MKKAWIVWSAITAMACVAFADAGSTDLGTIAMKDLTAPTISSLHGERGGSTLDTVGQGLAVITVPVLSPTGIGVSIAADCRGLLYYTNYGVARLYKMTATGVLVDSVDLVSAAGSPVYIDEMSWDEGRQRLWGGEDATFGIYLIDPVTGMSVFQFTGQVGLYPITDGLAYDPTDGTIWHSPDVSSSISHFSAGGVLLGTLIPLGPGGSPDLDISGLCAGTGNRLYVGHDGQGRISIVDKTTGAWISDFYTPGGRDEGLECDAINFAPDLVIWSKDAYNDMVTAIQVEAGTCACAVLPDTCRFTFQEVDMGDLPPCNYPTLVNNPAHGLSWIAWLGDCITGEPAPNTLNVDPCDDGVFFHHLPWTPCAMESVSVFVNAGPNFGSYQECRGHLYLNAWKDGNLDGDFCDELPCAGALASEWIIQDQLVMPGLWTFSFVDPGVLDRGRYAAVLRFRLTSQPVGRFGFGLAEPAVCNSTCGTFALDFLGEVEDYIIQEGQLFVELSSFNAVAAAGNVALRWVTASETQNDHFDILRNGSLLTSVTTQGNGASGHTYEYVDHTVAAGATYSYTLVSVDVNGSRTELATRTVTTEAAPAPAVITEYALHQNYPNPFNPTTSIAVDLVEAGYASLKVYNLTGQEVATIVKGNLSAGRHLVTFDARNLPSGLYLYKLDVNGFSAEKKMLLMK